MPVPKLQRRIWWFPIGAALLALALFAGRGANAEDEKAQMPAGTETGEHLFMTLCASCHGVSGQGDGPMAGELRRTPANLTLIAAKNDGKFPDAEIQEFIDGRRKVRSHGPGSMPVWGRRFERSTTTPGAPSELIVRSQVTALVGYLKTIQRPAP